MGLFNQGWGCRCDNCEEQVCDSIGGMTEREMKRYAKDRGWTSVFGTHWFCSADCMQQFADGIRERLPNIADMIDRKQKRTAKQRGKKK